jgi:HD-GYP domain-containing protein (c-di-GMP phosphodiesterase class II)
LAVAIGERLDGSGYPTNGVPAGELDPAARILTVADVYERPDRRPRVPRAWTVEPAVAA